MPVVVRFKSIGSAPIMKTNVFKVTAGNKFQAVITFLRGQLGFKAGDPLVSLSGHSTACDFSADDSSHISTGPSLQHLMT
jgi:hypothetical protein